MRKQIHIDKKTRRFIVLSFFILEYFLGLGQIRERIISPEGDTSFVTQQMLLRHVRVIRNGRVETFSKEGKMTTSREYKNNQLHGEGIYFYDDGEIRRIKDYWKGMEMGLSRAYYQNGNLADSGRYDLVKVGEWRKFYPDGTFKSSGLFSEGAKTGKWVYYYSTGAVKQKGICVDGLPHGIWKSYYESGVLKDSGEYILGVKNGLWMSYFESGVYQSKAGVYKSKGSYKNGLKVGEWAFYTDGGIRHQEGVYKKGKRHGSWFIFLESYDSMIYKYRKGKLLSKEYPCCYDEFRQTGQIGDDDWEPD